MADAVAARIATFATNPARASRELRNMLTLDPPQFRDVTLPLLCGDAFTQGHQFVLTLLISQGRVADRLCDLGALNRNEVRRLVERIDLLDGSFVVSVALDLLRGPGPGGSRDSATTGRALELIEHTKSAQRAGPILHQMLQSTDDRIRAKVALVLGKINRNLKWAEQRLNDSDPRVRANAIEAMWGLNSAEASRTFELAVQDAHGRVAANAAIGLYSLGDVSAVDHLIEMLTAPDPMRRAAGVWAMGQTGDPRFLTDLSARAGDPNPIVRKNVFQSLTKTRLRVKRLAEERPLQVIVTNIDTRDGTRRVEVAVLDAARLSVAKARPTNFVVRDAGRIQHGLTVKERRQPDATNAAFVVPADGGLERQFGPALHNVSEAFFQYKRPADAWSAMRYCAGDSGAARTAQRSAGPPALKRHEAASSTKILRIEAEDAGWDESEDVAEPSPAPGHTLDPGPRLVQFNPTASALLAVSDSAGTVSGAAQNLNAAVASLIGSLAFSQGARYMFIVAPSTVVLKGAYELALNAKEARIEIGALVLGADRNSGISDLCRLTGGVSITVATVDELPAAGRALAGRLVSFYLLEYAAPDGPAAELSVQMIADEGFGEDANSEQRLR